MKNDALDNMLEALTVGGRLTNEKSHALPQNAYRDPATTVKFPAEIERNRLAKLAKKEKRAKARQGTK